MGDHSGAGIYEGVRIVDTPILGFDVQHLIAESACIVGVNLHDSPT